MRSRGKIIYWIATAWLALGMLSTAFVQLLHQKDQVDLMARLDYPVYFLTILAICKIAGVVAVVIPGFPLLKEWAYAGFFFAMSGAVISHVASGSSVHEIFGPSLLILLTVVSWQLRPADRRLVGKSVPEKFIT